MKHIKKVLIFISLLAFSIIINIIPLFVFRDKIVISEQSYYSAMIMIAICLNGIISFFCRHKGNYLSFGTPRRFVLLSSDEEYTFTEEYAHEFYWMSLIYCFAIPFYIPCIFFVSKWVHMLWTLCVLLAPQLVFFIHDVSDFAKNIKSEKAEREKRKQELREQQLREEMGQWK